MTPETFLANLETLSEAPAGLNKIRELILELATSGRLIPQLQSDEPANASLQRNRENRRRVWLELHGRRPYTEPSPIPHEEMPPLPQGWAWERIEYLGEDPFAAVQTGPFGSQLLKTEFVSSGVPVIAVGNVGELSFKNDGRFFITQAKAGMLSRYDIQAGDLLFARTGSVGKVCVAPDYIDDWRMTGHILRLRLNKKLTLPWFIAFALRGSKFVRNQVGDGVKGTTRPGFNTELLERIIVPVPPIDEQRHIVVKVNQLMALCDELEAKQTQQQETGARLTHSALDALTSVEGPEEFAAAWRRVADNFETLLDKSERIRELRKAILSLAIRGQLVRQDPTDEPASEVLRLVNERRLRLVAEKKASRQEPTLDVESAEITYPAPPGWLWTRLGNVAICRDGQRIPLSKEQRQHRRGSYDYYGASGVIDTIDDFIFDEPLLLVGEDGANLINRSTPIAFIANGKYWVNNHAHVLDGATPDSLRYLSIFINAIDLTPYVTGTAQPKMNQAKMNSIPIAVPPLEEQKRIIAKVEHLMTLCDEFETKLRDAEKGAERLAEAMTAAMVA